MIKAAGVMYTHGNKVLLMKRVGEKGGTWAFPGGKIEDGESPEQAARREAQEETGNTPGTLAQIDLTHGNNVEFTTYQSRSNSMFQPVLNEEHDDYMWGELDNLPDNLHPGVAATLKRFGSEAMDDDDVSARQVDRNGYITIAANPISRSGIFQYLGKSIDKQAEPNKIYNVFRSAEELENPEALESMKLLPLIDEHVMLGPLERNLTPPENKGVQGSTGENIIFKNGVLFAPLKIFSQTLADMIKMGKRALSLGYHCRFIRQPGIFEGQSYDYVQKDIRGNHLALVSQARCDVAVLDHQMAFDHFDLALDTEEIAKMADNDTKEKDGDKKASDATTEKEGGEKGMSMEEAHSMMKQILPMVAKMQKLLAAHGGMEAEKEDDVTDPATDAKAKDDADFKPTTEKDAVTGTGKGVADEDDKKDEKCMDKKAKDEEEDDMDKKAMDSAIRGLTQEVSTLRKEGFKTLMGEVARRNSLADQLSQFVGTFDASEMSEAEVAAYGAEKLGLKCEKGQERAALAGFMHNRKPETLGLSAMDSGFSHGKKGKYAERKAKHAA